MKRAAALFKGTFAAGETPAAESFCKQAVNRGGTARACSRPWISNLDIQEGAGFFVGLFVFGPLSVLGVERISTESRAGVDIVGEER